MWQNGAITIREDGADGIARHTSTTLNTIDVNVRIHAIPHPFRAERAHVRSGVLCVRAVALRRGTHVLIKVINFTGEQTSGRTTST